MRIESAAGINSPIAEVNKARWIELFPRLSDQRKEILPKAVRIFQLGAYPQKLLQLATCYSIDISLC